MVEENLDAAASTWNGCWDLGKVRGLMSGCWWEGMKDCWSGWEEFLVETRSCALPWLLLWLCLVFPPRAPGSRERWCCISWWKPTTTWIQFLYWEHSLLFPLDASVWWWTWWCLPRLWMFFCCKACWISHNSIQEQHSPEPLSDPPAPAPAFSWTCRECCRTEFPWVSRTSHWPAWTSASEWWQTLWRPAAETDSSLVTLIQVLSVCLRCLMMNVLVWLQMRKLVQILFELLGNSTKSSEGKSQVWCREQDSGLIQDSPLWSSSWLASCSGPGASCCPAPPQSSPSGADLLLRETGSDPALEAGCCRCRWTGQFEWEHDERRRASRQQSAARWQFRNHWSWPVWLTFSSLSWNSCLRRWLALANTILWHITSAPASLTRLTSTSTAEDWRLERLE